MVSQKLSEFDVFGSTFNFFISKKDRQFRTVLGGVGTLLYFLTLFLTAIVFTRKYFDRSKPEVSVNLKLENRETPLDLYYRNFFMIFTVLDGADIINTEDSQKYLTITIDKVTTFQVNSGQFPEKREFVDPIESLDCRHLKFNYTDNHKMLTAQDSAALYSDALWCGGIRSFTQWWVQGSPEKLPYTRIVYNIYPAASRTPLSAFLLRNSPGRCWSTPSTSCPRSTPTTLNPSPTAATLISRTDCLCSTR